MELREGSWPVLDELVERLTEDRSADTRRRYGRAAAHLLAVLMSDDLPGPLDAATVRTHVPRLVEPERVPSSPAVGRTYLVLVARLAERLDVADPTRAARERLEDDLAGRPPDPDATRIPAKWRGLMTNS